jgi:hypothetical protein
MRMKTRTLAMIQAALWLSGCQQDGAGNSTTQTTVYTHSSQSQIGPCSSYDPSKTTYVRVLRNANMLSNPGMQPSAYSHEIWRDTTQEGRAYVLERLNIFLVQGDPLGSSGCALDMINGYSGLTTTLLQFASAPQVVNGFRFTSADAQMRTSFATWQGDTSGSGRALPEGIYDISGLRWMGGSGNFFGRTSNPEYEGLGPVIVSLTPDYATKKPGTTTPYMVAPANPRGGLEFHADVNEQGAPGSRGCLAFQPEDMDRFYCWMERVRPRKLIADWHLSTFASLPPYELDTRFAAEGQPSSYPCVRPPARAPTAPNAQGKKWFEMSTKPSRYQRVRTINR